MSQKNEKPDCGGTSDCDANCNGKEMASKAISEMDAENTTANQTTTKDDSAGEVDIVQINEFLAMCNEQGKDPILVVKHIAEKEGIDLSENAPVGESKKKGILRKFLMGAVRKFIINTTCFAIQNLDFEDDSVAWKDIIKAYAEDQFDKVCNSSQTVKPNILDTVAAVKILKRVEAFLSMLCRDGRCDDNCSACLDASDLADDVWDVLHPKTQEKSVSPEEKDIQRVLLTIFGYNA